MGTEPSLTELAEICWARSNLGIQAAQRATIWHCHTAGGGGGGGGGRGGAQMRATAMTDMNPNIGTMLWAKPDVAK